MTAANVRLRLQDRLPPLGGGLLWVYRIAFCLLALGAVAAMTLPFLQPMAHPLVTGLRTAKGVALIVVASILFRRRQSDVVAALLALAFLAWTITSSVDFTSADLWPQLLDRARFLLFALALLLFPNGDWQPAWTRHVAIASLAVFLLGILETLGPLSTRLFLPAAIGCILAAVAALIASYRNAPDEVVHNQLKWVALGLVAGIGLILTARAGAALGTGGMTIPWEVMFQCGIVIIAVGFLISLLRYRLFDADAIISRSAVYAVLTAALVATFAGSEALIELFSQQYLGSGIGQVSGAIAASIAAVLLTPLHGRISSWAESKFQADLAQLRTELPELLLDMPPGWSPEDVANAALPRIAEAIHAGRIGLILGPTFIPTVGMGAVGSEDDSSFPVRLPLRCPFGRIHGYLCIGPRPDGSLYGKDELNALDAILAPLRRRVMVAAQWSEHRLQQKATETEMAGELRAIRRLLAALKSDRSQLV
jgi:hypothetical protein